MTESLLFGNNFSINKHFEHTAAEVNEEILQSEFYFQHLDSSHLQGLDSGTEDDSEILYHIDNKYKTYNSAKRFFNSYASKTRVKSKRPYPDEMTSKDFFTLQFYNDSDSKVDAEKVPVCKGKSLKESIEIFLTKRDLSFNTHSVFLESSKTPLPLAFDTFPLGGNVLHVKANQEMQIDERIIMLMKGSEDKLQMGPRQKKSSEGADNSVHNGKAFTPINGKLNRKAGLFNSLKDMSRNISEMLAQHTMDDFENGDNNDSEFDNEIMLEDSWTDVITEVPELSQECKIQQEAIWELLMTERNYIRKIRVIIKVFQKYLMSLQENDILKEVDSNKLFSNILEVYEANMKFWTKHLNLVVKEVRKTKQIIRPLQLLDSFSNFEELFKPYIRYCLEEANCVKYLKRLKRHNEFFVEYLLWCEENHQCMRLKLADLLVKPMQRITKYNLLLKVILNKTHNQEECSAIESMITQVEQFVRKINTTLRLRHEEQKLNTVLDKLEQYLPIESATDEIEKVILDYCNFDLRARIPGLAVHEKRFLLFEGPMKIVEKQGRTDVHAFLFTDVLIMTKPKRGEKFRIVRQPYCLSKVVLHILAGSLLFIYLNEYGVMATAFTLLLNPNEQSKWLQAIEKAKTLYEKARKGNGSTSDFFDDDVTLPSLTGHSHSPRMSPLLFSRKISDADNNLHEVYKFTKEDISSHRFTGKSNEEIIVQEHSVKRSLSDPKPRALQWAYGKTFGNKPKNRPASFIGNHDQVTASWALTERELSGSLPNSVLSRRSSGIGDSFRSVNSDTCVSSRYTGIQNFNNPSEISNSEEVKNHLEISDHFENITALNQSHSLNDVSELSRSTDNGAKSFLVNNRTHQRLQFPNYSFHSDDKEESYLDSSIDSVKAFVSSRDDVININNSTENVVEKQFALQPICFSCSMHIKTTESGTQYDECVLKAPEILYSEIGVQTECNYRNVTTQCGDFIHLNSRSGDSDVDIQKLSDSYAKEKVNVISSLNSSTPLLDMLAALSPHDNDHIKKHKRGILKHAYSEANISHATIDQSEYLMHTRSHSDERHVPLKRNNSPQNNGPGMRALLTLSESLESSLQLSLEKEPEPKITTKTVAMKSNNNNALISPSNVKVFQNSSPLVPRVFSLDPPNNPTNTKVIMRNRPAGNHEISVRNTWNELDSLAALERIEILKHGVDHRRSSFDHRCNLDPNLSQSQADILDSSKKKSFKKEFFKRFSLSHKQDPSKKIFKEKTHKKKDKKQEKEDKKREKIFNSKASV